MPRVDELPLPAQNQIRAQRGEPEDDGLPEGEAEDQPVQREHQGAQQHDDGAVEPDLPVPLRPGRRPDAVDQRDRDAGDGQRDDRLGRDVRRIAKGGQPQLSTPALHPLHRGAAADAHGRGDGAVDRHRDHDVQRHVAAPDVLLGEGLGRAEDDVHEGRQDRDEEQSDVVARQALELQADDRGVHRVSSVSSWVSVVSCSSREEPSGRVTDCTT